MEDLKQLMQLIDEHSHTLPEGEYMKMCQNMKNIYPVVEKQQENEVFSELLSNATDDFDQHLTEFYANPWGLDRPHQDADVERTLLHQEFLFIGMEIKEKKNELKLHKVIQNVTQAVKTKAVEDYCRTRFLRLSEYTFKKLTETYPQCFPFDNYNSTFNCTVEQLNMRYTKSQLKRIEREFYNSYVNRENQLTRETRQSISYEIDVMLNRRLFIRETYSRYGFDRNGPVLLPD
tara:strand:+ start:1711 stop:2409 length:699 start_codon:yes stop_codon:yes gene_type:complete